MMTGACRAAIIERSEHDIDDNPGSNGRAKDHDEAPGAAEGRDAVGQALAEGEALVVIDVDVARHRQAVRHPLDNLSFAGGKVFIADFQDALGEKPDGGMLRCGHVKLLFLRRTG